jgi:phosphopantetheinyl transferase
VAIAAEGRDVGIDVEKVGERSQMFENTALGERERAFFASTADASQRDLELTRWWCAKEAVSKADGTGMGFKPQQFEVTAVDGDRLLVAGRWVETTVVSGPSLTTAQSAGAAGGTRNAEEYVVAWTDDARRN